MPDDVEVYYWPPDDEYRVVHAPTGASVSVPAGEVDRAAWGSRVQDVLRNRRAKSPWEHRRAAALALAFDFLRRVREGRSLPG